ncbi:glycoside hydrolase family 97 catalytic domain-containing protein [Streptomyces sp. V3I8]|uniref:glycoside hydrolase family 97 catalytic domain-containing protein n=1 Tax=Streptomyces sp. V3I8 TaxID=3042279 RepID=UPI0027D90B43|nr:glycoside hydrolase family 97 catalytic domain-containing protein [Streptomyces sp. V3I8]
MHAGTHRFGRGVPAWLAAAVSVMVGLGGLTPPASAADGRAAVTSWNVTHRAAEPGEALTARLQLDEAEGTLSLGVRRGSSTVLEPAPVGITTDASDLTSGLRLRGRTVRKVTERYSTTTGKQRRRTAPMTEARFSFAKDDGARLDLLVRVSDDGFAYRYVLPGKDRVTVLGEASAFQVPGDATAWLMPYTPNYERPRTETTASGAAAGDYGYPSLFRAGGSYVLLTESDVDGRYAGSRLAHEAGSGRYTVELADERIASSGPLATPWRTAVIGDLATVTESTLVDDLAPDSRVADTSWIHPGKVAWSWLAGFGAAQRSLETQQRFVDYSAAHGWEYTLVDDGWKTEDWMPRLIQYAQRRGVKILLWMHWTDLDTAAEREETLDKVKAWGAAGLKIDFMDSDAQERFRWYDDILEATAERELLVNFHGSTLPHGIQRTWPHVMSMEAVYGAEQGSVSLTDVTTLPFTRNVVGSMDYTPMGFQFGTRTTSEAAELALSVVYESGFQNFAGSVEAYRSRPELERFLEQVPTVWDETRLLSGHPGDGATVARRDGDRWFVGDVTAADGPATRRVPLDFLGSGNGSGRWRVEVLRDGPDGLVRDSRVTDRHGVLTVPTTAGGGFAAVLCRAVPGRTTCDRPVGRMPLTALSATPQKAQADPGTAVDVEGAFQVEDFGPVRDAEVRVSAPQGWTVTDATAHAGELATGATLRARAVVHVPADAAYGYHDVVVSASYRAPGEEPGGAPLRHERTVRVFVAPPGVDYVSDLPFAAERNGWGPVERDASNGENAGGDGGPLRIRGTAYDKGVGMHAAAEVSVDIRGAYDRFQAHVGVDDEVGGAATVVFEVVGDGRLLARTEVMTPADAARALDVDVSGVQRLTLRVTDGGDGINFDHADWGDALLRLADADADADADTDADTT